MGDRNRRASSSDSASSSDGKKSPSRGVICTNQTRKFRIPSHNESVLQALNQQRAKGEFCDITVLVEHQRFMAHKCILAANSDYFKGLLSNDNDGVFLRHITAESFRAILDFMYTSQLQLEPGHVQDVLTAAKFLQVKGVVSICCRYLESQIKNSSRNHGQYPSRHQDPPLLSIDGQLFKNKDAASFASPQPHITYDPTTGTFVPDVQMVAQPHGQTTNKPVFHFQPTTQAIPAFGIPQQAPVLSNGIPNVFPSNGVRVDPPMNPPISAPVFVSCPPVLSNGAAVHPTLAHHQPFVPTQVSVPQWSNSSYIPSFIPCQNAKPQRAVNPNHSNPFSQVSSHPVRLPPKAKPNKQPNNMFSSQSTGGKGRKAPTHTRRKQSNAAVSDTVATIPKFKNPNAPQNKSNTKGPVVMLSSARVTKSENCRTTTPDTTFEVEAEDRYWDSLSQRKSQNKFKTS